MDMLIDISPGESEVLAEILRSSLTQLRFEIARSDIREFRETLKAREEVTERLLDRLIERAQATTS